MPSPNVSPHPGRPLCWGQVWPLVASHRDVTGGKATAQLSPDLPVLRTHLHPSRSIPLVLGGDFLERSCMPRASLVEPCVGRKR